MFGSGNGDGMSVLRKTIVFVAVSAALGAALLTWYLETYDDREPSRVAYGDYCANCHGADLEGTPNGPALKNVELINGNSTQQLITSIAHHEHVVNKAGALDGVMLSAHTIKALALYVSEQRQGLPTIPGSHHYNVPEGTIYSQHHDFRIEQVTTLPSAPYSIAPLPTGEILVTEKVRGLSVVTANGQQSALIENTPTVWKELLKVRGSYVGLGMMLDIALHPDYANNGWIYLSHTERCQLDCNSLVPQTMLRVVRGKIRSGTWHSEELIWSVPTDFYTVIPDNVAAGRLAFDKTGHLFITVGGKSTYSQLHVIDTPYGKIHRVKDDGAVPEDNPYWLPLKDRSEPTTRHTVWSFGHRTTQGLASHPQSGAIWASEMGPRGGDEINRIVEGGNYGWPLYTQGLDYDGEPLTIGQELGLDFPASATIPPVVDFTPAPSLSNLTFHNGQQFSAWNHDLLVGSLRARTLFRLRIENNKVVELEKLIEHLGRIRDVAMGPNGYVYVLIEHKNGGSLLRLVPSK